jgi:ubiquinone/menaquinone biosynthesis C-methylase UbiE
MSTENPANKIFLIYRYCSENCRAIERWPSYFHRRYLEFISYLELFPDKRPERVLELGCGIGYQSAMLAQVADKVIATDLPDEDLQSHAPGMLQAQLLHRQLNIDNVELVGCSAEELPFESNSFDMVYSSHVFEHIPDRNKALSEIHRVLKPGGIHFCVVPTTGEKVYAFINFYTYLTSRSVVHLKRKVVNLFNGSKGVQNSEIKETKVPGVSMMNSFPFPPPHGSSKHYLNELVEWTPSNWGQYLLSKGQFEMISQSSSQINPLLSLLGAVIPETATAIHGFTRKLELKLGKFPFFRSIGINTVVVLRSLKKPQ